MSQHDVVVIGASAGGLPALTAIIQQLSPSTNAVVLVVMHTRTEGNGMLPAILGRSTSLPVALARDREIPRHGHIYVAPADLHLIVTNGRLRVLHGPRENGFRPAIDPLFRTAARVWTSRVIGVVLSGALDDGTNGLSTIKHFGGIAIVQDPEEAIIASMPRRAIEKVDVDYVLRAGDIGAMVDRLSHEETMEAGEIMARSRELEPQLPSEATEVSSMGRMYGAPSALTCPDCGGALWEIEEGRGLRYQCHTGHRYFARQPGC
jgi:two-component system chemotaxis response regulator CheB